MGLVVRVLGLWFGVYFIARGERRGEGGRRGSVRKREEGVEGRGEGLGDILQAFHLGCGVRGLRCSAEPQMRFTHAINPHTLCTPSILRPRARLTNPRSLCTATLTKTLRLSTRPPFD